MNLQQGADFATIAGVIAVPLSALAIWLQLRQQTQLARAANSQALVELSSPFNLQLIQDREMAKLWVEGAENYATYDTVDKYRYKSILIWWLILHENIYFQRQSNLLDASVYEPWEFDLKTFVRHQLRDLWGELKPAFQVGFVDHVEKFISEPAPAARTCGQDSARGE